MEFSTRSGHVASLRTDCLVLGIAMNRPLNPAAAAVDNAIGGTIQQLIKTGDFKAETGETLTLHAPAGITARRVFLLGAGDKFLNEQEFLKILASLANQIDRTPIKDATLSLDGVEVKNRDSRWQARQTARLFGEAGYRFEKFKSGKRRAVTLHKVSLLTAGGDQTKLRTALAEGRALANGINLTRCLGDLPANVCTPSYLASQARSLARGKANFTCKVLNEKQMRQLGMNALLSVTNGTEEPAKLIVMEYRGTGKFQKPVVLVGKGITFDSGGISLKPGAGMDEMKYDMCGAASVFGALSAVAEMQLPINVVGIVAAAENLPSGKATKPGDIVKSMSGQTIEILNTDAEGRLVLCDALTYAERYKPEAVIDIATLTGACVVALGAHASGLFSNCNELADQLIEAGRAAGDRAWQMPIWEEYDQQLKTEFADMANVSSGKGAGSITAACFLARYTKKFNWAHLDIAGTAWSGGFTNGGKKGATGRPVPLLVEFLRSRKGS